MPDSTSSRPRPSLTWWIFALALVPMLGAAGWATFALSRHPENASDREAAAALLRVAPAVEQALDAQADQLSRLGTMIARDPKFFAVLTLPSASRGNAEYREALEGVLRDFQQESDVPLFAVTDRRGKLLGRAAEPAVGAVDPSDAPFVKAALRDKPGTGYVVERERIYRVAAVPISAGGVLVGTLLLGRPVDADLGGRLKTAMEADLTLTIERGIVATTLVPSPLRKALSERLSERALAAMKPDPEALPGGGESFKPSVIKAGGRRYLAVRREIERAVTGGGSLGYVLTRPLGSDASPLASLEADLVRAAGLGIALALVCGAIVALAVMRERRGRERAHADEIRGWAERERSRSGFLAMVGRNVLDPSETVFTITDLVADGALGEVSGPQREGLLGIRRASRGLTRLGQDVCTIASLERGDHPLSPVPVEIGNLMEQAATLLIPAASERRQAVELSVEPGLIHGQVDPGLLSRVIEGLALHLVEGAPVASKVVLAASRVDGGIELLIAGERPEQGVGAGRDGAGEGVASTMARLFAARHEGRFEILAEEGLTYRIWLPAPVESPRVEEPAASAGSVEAEGVGSDGDGVSGSQPRPGDASDPAQAA